MEFWILVLLIFICEPNMNPQTKIVTLRIWAGFQANQGKCLGRVVVVVSAAHPLNHADFFESRILPEPEWQRFLSSHSQMCESKGLAPNVLRGVALGWGLLCLFRKRIMSGSRCQGYRIYKALWVLWMIFKVLCKIDLCIFTNLKERAETQLQWL